MKIETKNRKRKNLKKSTLFRRLNEPSKIRDVAVIKSVLITKIKVFFNAGDFITPEVRNGLYSNKRIQSIIS